ncbi:glycosyltransferase [Arcticibacter tournemirensis]|uniref:Glycosyltransferase family 2 protein n=1 Tax=Arcticibacter tournemirensis TaxID=699437 RepID=A0A4Q0M7V0_9SPHI|nr:glycosyltransferase [Arcticibacter tournemirensis]RXF69095.1 glycosyltransferase family 2 protein [Arcticibacter tournemirensis]
MNPLPAKYTIIICSYNPDDRLLDRCLTAVSSLLINATTPIEIIIVDNNSDKPLRERALVTTFLQSNNVSKLIEVSRPGLVYARVEAIKQSRGEFVVFFDDDNEADENYFSELDNLRLRYPMVGAWGPGKVNVDFVDGVDPLLERYYRPMFQEKSVENIEFAMRRIWQECYPIGTGLCIKRSLLARYVGLVENEKLTLTGRAGKKMTSGDDTQMVLLVILQNYAAGISPELKINHMISGKKLEFDYLKRLKFGTSCCYHLFHLELMPEYQQQLEYAFSAEKKSVFKVLKRYYKLKLKPSVKRTLNFVDYVGGIAGIYYAKKEPLPSYLEKIIKKMNLNG